PSRCTTPPTKGTPSSSPRVMSLTHQGTNMIKKIASWKSWEPADYFREYFSQQVEPDEQAGIRFQVDFLQRAGRAFPQALDYGCGPTLMRAIAASRYVAALDLAD